MIDWLKFLIIIKKNFSVKYTCDEHYRYIKLFWINLKIKRKLNKIELLEKIEKQNCKIEELQNKIKFLCNQIEGLKITNDICIDITKVPKANGLLKKLQEADTLALKIFHKFCEKNNLTYWLDGGTLLGAIRHNGFIPWDDDIDIAMPRKDYEHIRKNLRKELEQLNFEVNEGINFYHTVLRLIYKKSTIMIDLWPFENYYQEILDNKSDLENKIFSCHKTFIESDAFKNFKQSLCNFPIDYLLKLQNEIVNQKNEPISNGYFYSGCEAITYNQPKIYKYNWIYPLKLHVFEDAKLFIPNDYDSYLTRLYGTYMKLPDFSKFEMRQHLHIINTLQNYPLDDYYKELQNIFENITK